MLCLSFKMNNSGDNQANNNISALRADVAATTDVLKVTVDKLVQRGENLDAMNNRAEDLNSTSYHFRGTARRVHNQMRWQNWKLTFFISRFSIEKYFPSNDEFIILFSFGCDLSHCIYHLDGSSSMEEMI